MNRDTDLNSGQLEPDAEAPQDGLEFDDAPLDPTLEDEGSASTDEPVEPDQESQQKSSRSAAWVEAVESLPTLRSTSSGPYVKLLQAALNAFGGGYLRVTGLMDSSTKGTLKRNLEEAGLNATDAVCPTEMWLHLLGDKPPQYSASVDRYDPGLHFLQGLLSINGYPIAASGYWNEQTDRCVKDLGKDQGVKSAEKTGRPTVNLWVSLLRV